MRKQRFFIAIILGIFNSNLINAQNCSATSYGCYDYYGGNITSLIIQKQSGQVIYKKVGLSCAIQGSGVLSDTASTDLAIHPGEILTVSVKCFTGYYGNASSKVGLWLDLNFDNSFSSSECVISPSTGSLQNCTDKTWYTSSFVVPSYSPTKKLISFRFRSFNSVFSGGTNSQGCGHVYSYGNVIDVYFKTHKFPYIVGEDTLVNSEIGAFADKGGIGDGYPKNLSPTKNFMQIVASDFINLNTAQFQLSKSTHRLKIYKGYGDTGTALHPAGGWTSLHNNSFPKSIKTQSKQIYITFESDTSGGDTGFIINWKSEGMDKSIYKISAFFDMNKNKSKDITEKNYLFKSCIIDQIPTPCFSPTGEVKFVSLKDSIRTQIDSFYGIKHSNSVAGKHTFYRGMGTEKKFGVYYDTNIINKDLLINWKSAEFRRGQFTEASFYIHSRLNNSSDSIKCNLNFDREMDSIVVKNVIKKSKRQVEFMLPPNNDFDFQIVNLKLRAKSTDTGYVSSVCNCKCKSGFLEKDTANNSDSIYSRIERPKDPNEKISHYRTELEHMPTTMRYTINFQNLGTAPAMNVRIEDEISKYLDENTIEILGSSHSVYVEKVGKKVQFIFPDIQLADSATNEALSKGYVIYSIKVKQPLEPMKKVENQAKIYFDYEDAVITNKTINFWKSTTVITIMGPPNVNIDICDIYNDPGAVAIDNYYGNLTQNIVVIGKIDITKGGQDTLWYSVTTPSGTTTKKFRTITKFNLKKPVLVLKNKTIVNNQIEVIPWQSVFVDSVRALDTCIDNLRMPIRVPGNNGDVNTHLVGNYPIRYFDTNAYDSVSLQNGYTIIYQVKDVSKPTIQLNTADTIYHQVNTPYTSVAPTFFDNYSPTNKISFVKTGIVDPYTLGIYLETFYATDEAGNTAVKTRVVIVKDLLNQADLASNAGIRIYPNPAEQTLQIDGINSSCDYEIVNTVGEVVQFGKLLPGGNSINVSRIIKGIYFVKLSETNLVFRIVK